MFNILGAALHIGGFPAHPAAFYWQPMDNKNGRLFDVDWCFGVNEGCMKFMMMERKYVSLS
jgi:hypothetical protein